MKQKKQIIEQLKLKTEQAPEEFRALAFALLEHFDRTSYRHYFSEDLLKELKQLQAQNLEELFEGPFYQLIIFFTHPKRAEKIKQLVLQEENYLFQTGLSRRSYRSSSTVIDHMHRYLPIIQSMILFEEMDLVELLHNRGQMKQGEYPNYDSFVTKNNEPVMNYSVFELMIASELNAENPQVIHAVEDILFDEQASPFFVHPLIRGILKSNNMRMVEALGQLFLAAARQEGLRQVIAENIDHGTLDAQIYMMKLIDEHNLIRFSSVLRAVDTWMGLGYNSFENQKLAKEVLHLSIQAIEDVDFTNKLLESERTIDVFVALWSIATKDYQQLGPALEKLLKREKHIQLTTLYFAHNLSEREFTAKFVEPIIFETSDIELFLFAWENYTDTNISYYRDNDEELIQSIESYFARHPYIEKNARALFERIEFVKANMNKEGLTISGKPFSFVQVHISYEGLVRIQLAIAHKLNDQALFTRLLEQADRTPADSRLDLLKVYCIGSDTQDKRELLFRALHDRSSIIRDFAFLVLKQLPLAAEEIENIEDLLLNKSGDTRKEVITFLLKQSEEQIFTSLDHLLTDRKQLKRLGGLELLLQYHKKNELPREKLKELCAKTPAKTDKEKTLLKQILVEAPPEYTFENGFGLFTLYQPINYNTFAEFQIEEDGPPAWEQLAQRYMDGNTRPIQNFFAYDLNPLLKKLKTLTDLLDEHAEDEYSYYSWNDTIEQTTLGNEFKPLAEKAEYRIKAALDSYPLAEELVQWVEQSHFSMGDLEIYAFYTNLGSITDYDEFRDEVRHTIDRLVDIDQINRIAAQFSELKYRKVVNRFMNLLSIESNAFETETVLHEKARQAMRSQSEEFDPFDLYFALFAQVLMTIPSEEWRTNLYKPKTFRYHRGYSYLNFPLFNLWYKKCSDSIETYRHFLQFISLSEELAKRMDDGEKELNMPLYQFSLHRYLFAVENEMLTKDHLYQAVFAQQIHSDTFVEPETLKAKYKYVEPLLEVRQKSIERLLEIELNRGDLATAATRLVKSISYLEGVEYFIRILQALQGEKLARNYLYSPETKKEVFSHLLSHCYPAKTDTSEKLKEALKKGILTEEELIEAMMFHTHWVDLVSEAIGWPGLKSAVWYFSAHTADYMPKYSADQIALYSQISNKDFQDGAFDLNWFQEAYNTLGPERFKLVYQAAKYVSSSSSHRRAQLYADAAIGKLDAEKLMEEISEKRNKDKLRCLGLIPLKNDQEALERYQFLQNFLKESKQFGAQRRASEARACQIALENLARNAGAGEITRFQWRMELKELDQLKPYFTTQRIENIEVNLQVNEEKEIALHVVKDGKSLKGVPAKLKKHPEIEAMQKARKALTEQYRRSRTAFEDAMELQTEFQAIELQNLLQHPVLAQLVQTLVVNAENQLGIVTSEGLELVNGEVIPLVPSTGLTIAHPYHLLHSNEWRKWQERLFAVRVKQPFKQIFRELYLVNDDEREKNSSKRYAGHQIQPSKTVSLLKSRGWQVSHEDGLRKIYYKHNIAASLYALADWYSPSDVEAPTIEGVHFYDRLTWKHLHLESIPPTLFSEVMRDIDLVVSIAHVGGVDPEASHSTIEMRAVIVEELAKLLKLGNVSIKKNHAIINGRLAQYTVHLGSGIVHQLGGTEVPILAIQSQHRGRIFLPMVDEDPRTAEIMSKILLLSEDHKIKDPFILQRIKQFN